MSDGTKIEWADATWNPITGCSVISPGCTNCYAMRLAGTRLRHHPTRVGLTTGTKAGPVWTGEVRFNEEALVQPLHWRNPRRIFVCAHGDLFHESVPDDWIDQIFAVMAMCPQHIFQVLTKRAHRMHTYMTMLGKAPGPLPNVWLGVSVEDQVRADERIPILLDTPATIRWISAEPLLGPINLHSAQCRETGSCRICPQCLGGLDWVVVGGESGPGARPMNPDWALSLRDQCAVSGVPFFFKQWGEWAPGFMVAGQTLMNPIGKKAAGRDLDGCEHNGFPGDN